MRDGRHIKKSRNKYIFRPSVKLNFTLLVDEYKYKIWKNIYTTGQSCHSPPFPAAAAVPSGVADMSSMLPRPARPQHSADCGPRQPIRGGRVTYFRHCPPNDLLSGELSGPRPLNHRKQSARGRDGSARTVAPGSVRGRKRVERITLSLTVAHRIPAYLPHNFTPLFGLNSEMFHSQHNFYLE